MKKFVKKDTLTKVGGLGAGAVGANLLGSKIPVGNSKVKNAIIIVAGLFVGSQKSKFVQSVGDGMVATGVGNLAKEFGIGGTIIGEVEDVIIEGLEDPIDGSNEPGEGDDERNTY